MKKFTCFLLALLLMLSLAACGSSQRTAETSYGSYQMAADMAAPEAEVMEEMGTGAALRNDSGTSQSGSLPENHKWIVTVNMSVETEDLDTFLTTLEENLSPMEGFVENQEIYNGSTYSSRRHRNARLTLRIPVAHVEEFTTQMQGIANVVSNNLRREDVTLTYVATESKVNALKTEEARLLELLAKAETMSDLLEIEARLSDVRYELEAYATQLRTLTNQIDYATIRLSAEEVKEYTPVAEPTLWERITSGFADSLEGLGESLQDLLVLVIVSIPYLVVYIPLGYLLYRLIRKLRKHRKERKEQKAQQKKQKET